MKSLRKNKIKNRNIQKEKLWELKSPSTENAIEKSREVDGVLKFVLESNIDGRLVYIFYPEGQYEPGRVAFNPDGSMELIEDSPYDVQGYYRGHALHGIDRTREWGTVAWC